MSDQPNEEKEQRQKSETVISAEHLSDLNGGTAAPTPTDPSQLTLDAESAMRDLTKVPPDSSLFRIPVQVTAVIGRSVLQVSELLKLQRGAIIELDSKVGGPIDIYVNNRRVARGDLIVAEDRLSISMTEVLKIQDS